jgi:hypothetical protein
MTPSLRVAALLLGCALCVPGICRAQGKAKTKAPDIEASQTSTGMKGTSVKKAPVLTDDDIGLLVARQPAKSTDAAKAEPAAKDSPAIPQDPEQRKAEIAALEQQIKEKQSKMHLLMQMFVIDEEAFFRDTTGGLENDDARAKRRFEQDEMLREGKELGQLRARLDLLQSLNAEKSAPAKPVASN